MFRPIWRRVPSADGSVGRWDVPSADVPSADWAKCSQMGPSHLPTARLQMGRCSQMGWNIYIDDATPKIGVTHALQVQSTPPVPPLGAFSLPTGDVQPRRVSTQRKRRRQYTPTTFFLSFLMSYVWCYMRTVETRVPSTLMVTREP